MKMPQELFEPMKRDFFKVAHAWANAKGSRALTIGEAWTILSRVEQERQYTGELRGKLEEISGVPCSVDAIAGYRMGPWYKAGLNDAHVATALRRILAS